VDEDKIFEWLKKGAQLSDGARSLLKKTGTLKKWDSMHRGSGEARPEEAEVGPEEVGAESQEVEAGPEEAEAGSQEVETPDKEVAEQPEEPEIT
jgi:hypothetical protein